MGRKSSGGGTAGGGRSGKRGNVTFTRVVPRFLQKLNAEQEKASVKVDRRNHCNKGDDGEEKKDSSVAKIGTNEIAELEKAGFNVVAADVKLEVPDSGTGAASASAKCASGSDKKIPVRGGIEKKRTTGVRPSISFKVNNVQRLSFATEDNDSDSSN